MQFIPPDSERAWKNPSRVSASYSKKISSWSFVPFILSNFDNYFMCIHVFRVRNNRYNWKNNFGFEKIKFYHHFHGFFIDFIVIFEKSWKSWKISWRIPNESLTKWTNLKSTLSEHNLANFIVINKRFLQGFQKMYFTHRKQRIWVG